MTFVRVPEETSAALVRDRQSTDDRRKSRRLVLRAPGACKRYLPESALWAIPAEHIAAIAMSLVIAAMLLGIAAGVVLASPGNRASVEKAARSSPPTTRSCS